MQCDHCGGLMMDRGDDELHCAACGRSTPMPGEPVGNAVVINLELRPETLKDFLSAVAFAEGKKPAEVLEGFGLSTAQAKQMATGGRLFPQAVLALMKKYSITPSQLVTLMENQVRGETQAASPARSSRATQGNRRGTIGRGDG